MTGHNNSRARYGWQISAGLLRYNGGGDDVYVGDVMVGSIDKMQSSVHSLSASCVHENVRRRWFKDLIVLPSYLSVHCVSSSICRRVHSSIYR